MLSRARACLFGSVVLSSLALAACSSSGDGSPVASSSDAVTVASVKMPSWATTSSFAGRLDASSSVSVQVHLRMRSIDDARAALEAIANPDDARYAQFLSDDEFAAKYAPTAEDVAAVRAHLEGHGLRVTEVPDNRAYVTVEGPAAQVEKAFATRLGQYRVGEETRRAPMDAVKLPSAVASHVATVLGLATPPKMRTHTIEFDAAAAPPACAEFYDQQTTTPAPAFGDGFASTLSDAICGYKPAQLRQAYGFNASVRAGNDGHGQTIAIVDAWTPPTLVKDAQTYAANEDGDYPLATSQITLYTGPGTVQPPNTGWYGESSLDVEAAHAIAPGANIAYVGAASDNDPDLIAAINLIVTKHLASIVSNSYDGLELQTNDFAAWESIALQAGLKGIGLYFASGDSGDESANNSGTPTVDFPASLPEVTAVGGTSLALGADGSRTFEVGWENGISHLVTPDGGVPGWSPAAPGSYGFGAGGGTSVVYLQPKWQAGVVPASLSTFMNAQDRVVPDVAMLADPYTGFLIGRTRRNGQYGEGDIGGTSLATPLFSATVALAQQHAKRVFGFANPLFYKASKRGAFTDIAPPASPYAVAYGTEISTLDFHGAGNTNATAVGFDSVTGLGVPNGTKFFAAVR